MRRARRRQRPVPAPPAAPVSGGPASLSEREQRFVEEYLASLNGAQAAINAGYRPKNARAQASRLLTKANISTALQAGFKARQTRTELTGDSTVRAVGYLAHSDIRRFYDAAGNLKPIHSLPDDLAMCIASVEVVKRNFASGDGKTELVHKIKLWNKPQALELLGRYQGLGETPLDARPPVPAFCLPADTPGVSVH